MKLTLICIIYVFASPYLDHDAFMRHALHVLDASGYRATVNPSYTLDARGLILCLPIAIS